MGRGVLVNFRGSCLLFPMVCRILDDGKAYTHNQQCAKNNFEGR